MKGVEIFELLASRYSDKPDEYQLSVGHHALPDVSKPLGIYNLPEFCGYMALNLGQIRRWANGMDSDSGDIDEN